MKTCSKCGAEYPDDVIRCTECDEILLECGADNHRRGISVTGIQPKLPTALSINDVVLGKLYGKRIIKALRVIAVMLCVLLAVGIVCCGVLCITGKNTFGFPVEKRMLFGLVAMPAGLIAAFMLYFIFNIFITKYENLSLVGRNTEAQLNMLENQSELLSALIGMLSETNRRIDLIGGEVDDLLHAHEDSCTLSERQIALLEKVEKLERHANETVAAENDNILLLNENLCAGISNNQTLLGRLEHSFNSGFGELIGLFEGLMRKPAKQPDGEAAANPDTGAGVTSAEPDEKKETVPQAQPAKQSRQEQQSKRSKREEGSGSGKASALFGKKHPERHGDTPRIESVDNDKDIKPIAPAKTDVFEDNALTLTEGDGYVDFTGSPEDDDDAEVYSLTDI